MKQYTYTVYYKPAGPIDGNSEELAVKSYIANGQVQAEGYMRQEFNNYEIAEGFITVKNTGELK